MKNRKLNSTTAMIVTLSFLQPLPGLAQSSSVLQCLQNFSGDASAAESACLDTLVRSGVACDPGLSGAGGNAGPGNGDEPLESVAARIMRTANAQACAAEDAAAAAQAQAEAEAAAAAEAEAAAAAAAAEAEAAAAAEAEAAQAQAEAEAEALAAEEAEAEAEAATAESVAAAIAETAAADAAAAAARAQAEAEAEAAARAAAEAQDCTVELVDATGATLCADEMSQAEIAAITADAAADENVVVTTETIAEDSARTSSEEFAEAEAGRSGISDLERAGLFALGALAIGAILSNGQRVTARTDDRVVLQDQYGNFSVLKNEDVLVQTPGSNIRTETFNDGSMRTFVTREDGSQIVTIINAQGRVLRRSKIDIDGNEVLLIDDTRYFEPVEIEALPEPSAVDLAYLNATDTAGLRAALRAAEQRDIGRTFSLSQVRQYRELRNLAPEINLDRITFATGSAAIAASEAGRLREIGLLMLELIDENPNELFLIEGYTDAVGDESYNLLLSDRRAETVALALTEYFGVWPENMVVQGYGERFLLIPTLKAERLNRRVAVRRITNLVN